MGAYGLAEPSLNIFVLHQEADFENIWRVYSDLASTIDCSPSNIIVLTNEEVIAKHQEKLEDKGLYFFEDWRENRAYRDLVRRALQEGDMYLMFKDEDRVPDKLWNFKRATESDVEIRNLEEKVDIVPRI